MFFEQLTSNADPVGFSPFFVGSVGKIKLSHLAIWPHVDSRRERGNKKKSGKADGWKKKIGARGGRFDAPWNPKKFPWNTFESLVEIPQKKIRRGRIGVPRSISNPLRCVNCLFSVDKFWVSPYNEDLFLRSIIYTELRIFSTSIALPSSLERYLR